MKHHNFAVFKEFATFKPEFFKTIKDYDRQKFTADLMS